MQIKWTKRALNRLESSVNYCQRNFGERVAIKYYQKVKRHTSLLVNNPHLGKIEHTLFSKHTYEYRSLVVHPYFKLIYYINVNKERIVITNLWDVRQEPDKLTKQN